jgi:hypothetical protein
VNKKAALLFLGLVLPVLIFIFLKLFGKNQFDVPLPYANGVQEIPAGCDVAYPEPYRLADSVIHKISSKPVSSLLLVNFGDETPKLRSILKEFAATEITVSNQRDLPRGSELEFLKKCVLLMKDPATMILIDREKNIRGHYDGNDRDDLDRLDAELTIILKKY